MFTRATQRKWLPTRTNAEGTYSPPASDHTLNQEGYQSGDHEQYVDSESNRNSEQRNEDGGDGGEKGGEQGQQQPVGFFHSSLNHVRLVVFRKWALTVLILCTFIMSVLSLYWAVLFNVEQNLNSLIVFVVNFETDANALVGPMVTEMTEAIVEVNATPHLGYITVPPSAYNNDALQVREAVYSNQAWAAIVINSNATTLLRQAVEQGNSSYDPMGAMQLIYQDSRDQDTYYDYILPMISSLQTEISSSFGETWARTILANTSITRSNLQAAPQAVNPAIGFSTFNLRPFYPYVAVPAVTVGLIYLIIIAFFSFAFFMPIHMKFMQPEGHPPLKFNHLIVWRWASTIVAYFLMSLVYSFVSLAFQIPFSNPPASHLEVAQANKYGKGSFPVYWMINFVGMTALGLACENVAMVIGQPWTSFWLIFWVISNVSTSFYAIETSPGFFRWGYAWPLHNIVEASRTVIFDLHSRIGLNFGVLFTWAGIGTILFPFCCYFMRWKTQRQKKKAQ